MRAPKGKRFWPAGDPEAGFDPTTRPFGAARASACRKGVARRPRKPLEVLAARRRDDRTKSRSIP